MRFLIDQNQSPLLVELIAVHGHDVAHARDRGRSGAPDRHILEVAIDRSSILGVSSVIGSWSAGLTAGGRIVRTVGLLEDSSRWPRGTRIG